MGFGSRVYFVQAVNPFGVTCSLVPGEYSKSSALNIRILKKEIPPLLDLLTGIDGGQPRSRLVSHESARSLRIDRIVILLR